MTDFLQPELEKMQDFFTARLETYESHMLAGRGQERYQKMADLIPYGTTRLLDLGCGTGLELKPIFQRFPVLSVVGIDLTPAMLDILRIQFPNQNLRLICDNYFETDLGQSVFDAVVSAQTLHHFSRQTKMGLYTRLLQSLKPHGVYIEDDYMVSDQIVEDSLRAKNKTLRLNLSIPEDAFYHFDIPFTVEQQMEMLEQTGFRSVSLEYRYQNDAIILARK
jgi:tRNA (cmo5U34)-methyltransferase